ncbi:MULTISPECIES: shikimate dehydrogenase [Asticcacaulis]|uniref:shikimate dehydrogenase family protein n=1 Tax=Asticcacaulis TaxID=76890 RepID=UPI001AE63332|nr:MULTISPECIES: shikimate dehydrogenase [Asticcacaulis]MBP2159893.1 shikimate dehydrogenase [Asticcacaulis solisilvae]MDR6800938.1 shikimate dehydrogenase [Asticcacaulis sp. BE141]
MIDTLPTGAAKVAAIVGQPVHHSMSPFLHNAWLRTMKVNGVYAAFGPKDEHAFERLILSCRTNGIKGLNITAPFKAQALALADTVAESARHCGSANVLTFDDDGYVHAQSTDGHGLIRAFELQAPDCDLKSGPVVIMGAGGASRAAVAAMLEAGSPEVRIVNRTLARAEDLVFAFQTDQSHIHLTGKEKTISFRQKVTAYELTDVDRAFAGAVAVINAASGGPLPLFDALGDNATIMDMTYRPLKTNWLKAAEERGLKTVDGLGMLIEQARPSFEAFYGRLPDADYDIRGLALQYLGEK